MESPFLCTTALSEFWNLEAQKILFLGSWCLCYDNRKEWENLNYEVLPHPWDDRERMYRDAEYQNETYEDLLKILSNFLNEAHGEKHDSRYWRIIIGPWLLHYIQVLHERFLCLNYAFERYPHLATIGLSESSFKIARDSWEHILATTQDIYNLQIYTAIIQALGYRIPKRNFDWDWQRQDSGRSLIKKRLKKFWNVYIKLHCRWTKRSLTLIDLYLPWHTRCQIMLCTGLKTIWYHQQNIENLNNRISSDGQHHYRIKLGTLKLRKNSKFGEVLISTLPSFFPLIFLENYRPAREWLARHWQGTSPKTLMTGTSLIANESFKFLAAKLMEEGAKLIGLQHGGSYGSARYNPLEEHEVRVSDEFWSWGWGQGQTCIRPMPSPKLSLLAAKRRSYNPKIKNYILFVGNNNPRYHYRTWSYHIANQGNEYIGWQIKFLNDLQSDIREKLIYRPYPTDYGWCLINRLKDKCPDVNIDDRHTSYDEMLSKASLVVCDMNVTTIAESLAADIPTIAFWDRQRNELRPEAEPFFQILRDAGILYHDPAAAAAAVNQKWPKLQEWWKQPEVQQARDQFVSQYAYHSADWEREWCRFLMNDKF
jgi:putative transferase (TIGR04331 family)